MVSEDPSVAGARVFKKTAEKFLHSLVRSRDRAAGSGATALFSAPHKNSTCDLTVAATPARHQPTCCSHCTVGSTSTDVPKSINSWERFHSSSLMFTLGGKTGASRW